MQHSIYKIASFSLAGDYKIEIAFNDNTRKTIDFSPILYGEMYGPLKDPGHFKKVILDKEVCALVWPNGADFDPSLLHDWEHHVKELSLRAKEWSAQEI